MLYLKSYKTLKPNKILSCYNCIVYPVCISNYKQFVIEKFKKCKYFDLEKSDQFKYLYEAYTRNYSLHIQAMCKLLNDEDIEIITAFYLQNLNDVKQSLNDSHLRFTQEEDFLSKKLKN